MVRGTPEVVTALDLTGGCTERSQGLPSTVRGLGGRGVGGGGLRGRRFQATPRQPGLNSHLNASEVALTAITADGRLLTHALPAKAEPPASPPASLDGAFLSVPRFRLRFASSPVSFPFARCLCSPTSDSPFIVTISRKRREGFKAPPLPPSLSASFPPWRPIIASLAIIPADERTSRVTSAVPSLATGVGCRSCRVSLSRSLRRTDDFRRVHSGLN